MNVAIVAVSAARSASCAMAQMAFICGCIPASGARIGGKRDQKRKGNNNLKSQHFCTPGLLRLIKIIMHNEGMSEWEDFRTFWIPNFEEGEVIQVKERIEGTDYPLCQAEIVSILPVRYKEIDLNIVMNQEQVDRYKRKFHPGHWFFKIRYRIVREEKKGLDKFML